MHFLLISNIFYKIDTKYTGFGKKSCVVNDHTARNMGSAIACHLDSAAKLKGLLRRGAIVECANKTSASRS
jgi:hypothetical protein